MNTSAIQYTAEPCWSRRCSTESIYSIQARETDYVRDTSDTESFTDDDEPVEYEPFTEPENEAPVPILGDSSGQSDNDIITTKVVEVSVGDDGDLEFADSEQTASDGRSDSELELCDYGRCALCGGRNTTPRYRYCQKCFKVGSGNFYRLL
uniref:Uncharacterized protein n=1 Tax=Pectinophora gossypiella TaxID=13191 RepID=A0A1E1WNS9_PECGO